MAAGERRVTLREAACARHFTWWPWTRLNVDAAEIASAVKLFDAARVNPLYTKDCGAA
jgi:hypothetical protein